MSGTLGIKQGPPGQGWILMTSSMWPRMGSRCWDGGDSGSCCFLTESGSLFPIPTTTGACAVGMHDFTVQPAALPGPQPSPTPSHKTLDEKCRVWPHRALWLPAWPPSLPAWDRRGSGLSREPLLGASPVTWRREMGKHKLWAGLRSGMTTTHTLRPGSESEKRDCV